MKQIYEQNSIIKNIIGKQVIDESKKYRKFFYLTECPVDNGIVICNDITYEFIFLDNEESGMIECFDISHPTIKFLIEKYFLVPEDFDDKKFGINITNMRIQIQNIYRDIPFSNFVILPTTGCNARCFYCFEKGAKVSNMTEQTAYDVVDFILKKGAKKIKLMWFGGEPLINIKPIDIICSELENKGIDFESKIVTNAYNFTNDVIEKAKNLWRLKQAQITLDGTEEVYNNVKNYVYKNVSSPFLRVLNNIENVLKADIQVNIRLNMDEHNSDDLFSLSKILIKKYSNFSNCYIYVVRLFENTCSKIKTRDVIDRHKIIEDSIKLSDFITANMPKVSITKLPKSYDFPNSCMASLDNSVMIVPDGHLGKCEHYIDNDFFGSIYDDKYDIKKIQAYKEHIVPLNECYECKYFALCLPLKVCTASIPTHCDELDKKAMETRRISKIMNIYYNFLQNEVKD